MRVGRTGPLFHQHSDKVVCVFFRLIFFSRRLGKLEFDVRKWPFVETAFRFHPAMEVKQKQPRDETKSDLNCVLAVKRFKLQNLVSTARAWR